MTISRKRFAVIAALMLMASPALAQDGNPQIPFDEARVLMKSGRFAEALPKLEQSLAIKVTGGALLNYADCLEKLGRYASAVDAFDRARAMFEDTKDARRADEAKNRATTLRPMVSTITVKSATKEVTVVLDSKRVAANTPIPVDGGEHSVTVLASCHKPIETKVSVALRSDPKEIPADLTPTNECGTGAPSPPPPAFLPGAATSPPPPPRPSSPPPPSPSSQPNYLPIAIAAGAVGLVGVGLGTFFGLKASSTKDDLTGACTDYPRGCPLARQGEIRDMASDADTQAAASTAAFIVGGVFLAGAVVLYVISPKKTPAPTRVGIAF
jgi:hypothetical protein